jgi:hypothetical protein
MADLPKYIERTGEREVAVTLKGGERITLAEPRGRKAAKAITAASQVEGETVYALAQAILQHCMVSATGSVAWPDKDDPASAFARVIDELYFSDVQRIAGAASALLVPDEDEEGN